MTIRERQELLEEKILSPYATLSKNSKGREREEEQCDIRPVFQRDRDRIIHAKSFRRMMHKTQVFFRPKGDHYRTRLTHTLEVSQISRTIAKALNMNESLTEAIALGHDLGHTPFGHSGEQVLNSICPYGFEHSEQSVRVVSILEKAGRGLNLTFEVKDGILNHSLSKMPSTPEGQIVRLSDKIAYINHDIDDAIRGQIIKEDDIPAYLREMLGGNKRERLNTMINGVIDYSYDKPEIEMEPALFEAMKDLRSFMFEHVYSSPVAMEQEDKAKVLLKGLYEYYLNDPYEMSREYIDLMDVYHEPREKVVCDYIAGMTDQYAVDTYKELVLPNAWGVY